MHYMCYYNMILGIIKKKLHNPYFQNIILRLKYNIIYFVEISMEAANILIFTHISPRVHHPYGTVDDAEISNNC